MIKKNTNKEAHNNIFDLFRIILTFLVVNIHIRNVTHEKVNFLEPYGYFAVPIFMTLSFFLMYKYFSQIKLSLFTVWKRIKRLSIPLIFWSAVGFIFKPHLFNIKNILLQVTTGKVVDTPLYYLIILIIFSIIFWMITYLQPKFRNYLYFIFIILAFVLEYTGINTSLFNSTINEVRRCYGQIVELIKYASLGMLYGYLINRKSGKFILLSLIFVSLIILIFFKLPQPWGYNYSGLKLFLGTILVFSSSLYIDKLNFSNSINQFIKVLGGYSFGVYLFHIIFLERLIFIFPSLKYFNTLFPFHFLFIYTAGCYLFCIIFDSLTLKKFSYLIK